jgi:inorganic phosphate transporter, PiT family
MEILLLAAALLLCYSNGANDNFKGFATVWGSGAGDYDTAIRWATVTTVAGAIAGLYLAEGLVASFSGRGLVPDAMAGSTSFIFSVATGAGLTVLLATLLGFPISTTHGLIGALVGAGLAAPGGAVNFSKLGQTFVLPLLASPVLSATTAALVFWVARKCFSPRALQAEACVCEAPLSGTSAMNGGAAAMPMTAALPQLMVGTEAECAPAGARTLFGFSVQRLTQRLHYFSAASICFARGVNDTPKLVALLLAAKLTGLAASFWVVALAMAVGGWFGARKVAVTMSKNIVPLNEGQGFAANLVTSLLVIFASKFGMPVSTTHVSVGSISGVGLVTGTIEMKELTKILLSWVVTLPLAAALAAAAQMLVRGLS